MRPVVGRGLWVAACLGGFAPALAAPPPKPAPVAAPGEAEYERAVQLSQSSEPALALAQFEQALSRLSADHSLRTLALYGAGRAAQRLDTAEAACRAVRFYQDFVARPDAEADKRKRASEHLPALAVRCAGATAAPASAPPSAVASAPPPEPAPAPGWRPWVGWGAIGASALLGGVGGYYWAGTFDAQDEAARTDIDRRQYDRAAQDVRDGGRNAWIFTGLAGAALAGGLTALLWPAPAESGR